MSDRTQASVRTGTLTGGAGEAAASPATEAGTDKPVSATQSIPTGANRVVQADRVTGAVPSQSSTAASGVSPATGTGGVRTTAAASDPATKASSTADPKGGNRSAAGRGPRRARLQLRHIDTWSGFKISFVLSVALFFIWLVAVGVLYGVLSGLGVFDTLNDLFGQLGTASGSGLGGEVITPGVVFGAAAVIGAVNIILLTALGTVATFIYNLCSDLVGGLELTLSERD
jgi:hypothetical protein